MMKQHLIYLLTAFLAIVAVGCTQEELDSRNGVELTVELTMASDMQTRAPRPLESVDNWQHVTNVRVYVFRSDTENGVFSIYQPMIKDEQGEEKKFEYIDVAAFQKTDIYKEDVYESHQVFIKPQLPEGYYRLLAIGVDEEIALFKEILKDGTKWDDVLKTVEETPITNEFFSGYSETINISSSVASYFIKIELKRCVAGILLYVKNIPEKYDNNDITSIKLILAGYSQTTDIVNRVWKSEAIPSEIVLADFKAGDENDTIKNDDGTEKIRYYSGKFLVPSRTSQLTEPTLRLVYLSSSENGTDTIKSKNVMLINASDDDYSKPELNIDRYGTHYNLIANHLYCLGFRSETIKDPIDLTEELNKTDNVVRITVYGSWQADVDITL